MMRMLDNAAKTRSGLSVTYSSARTTRLLLSLLAAVSTTGAAAEPLAAQWVTKDEQFYLPAEHNWVFRRQYPQADRLFNAFDYGHAILYEQLYTRPGAPASELEEREYDFITRKLLVSPPRLPLEESAIEPQYSKLAPEAKLMFEWAHLLHRQIYDILGDPTLSDAEKDGEVARVIRYYKSRPDLAFSSVPKNMELMEGQYYSTAFREGFPKFNGLIWAYHWLQVGLYEPLLLGKSMDERQAGVTAAVTRFRQMLIDAPEQMPRVMPMTAAIAPEFTRRYPEAAIIFDNLHGMHDVISDILASDSVPAGRKRAEILIAAERYRDATSFTMTVQEWQEMAAMMGANNMGGPATGFLASFPVPTVARGAVMASMDHAAMGHGAAPDSADEHAGHDMSAGAAPGAAADTSHAQHGPEQTAHAEMHARMMADPVIRARIEADPELRRMFEEMHGPITPAQSQEDSLSPAAADFIRRLLADPTIEARVHADPRLHQLWSDPAVQRRLQELRSGTTQSAPATPAHAH